MIEKYGEDIVDNTTQYNEIKERLIHNTPMTEEQFEQFSEETILKYAGQVSSGDAKEIFNQLVNDYPEVFEEETTQLREKLVEQTQIHSDSLREVPDTTLLWQAYQIINQSDQNTTMQDIDLNLLLNQLVVNGVVNGEEIESEETHSEPKVKTDTRTGVEANSGNEPKNSQSTELTPGANASFPELSSESSSVSSEPSEPTTEQEDLPLTGERSPWFYFIAGSALLIVALLLIFSGKRRK